MPDGFSSLGVREDLVTCLERLGVREPYPIQSATLPDALAGRDIVAKSPTGSGKTLAFALAIFGRIGRAQPHRPRGLVLTPTRELAAQITEVMHPLARTASRRVVSIYGGTGYGAQLRALERGVDVIVACPGRLNDLVQRGAVDLAAVEVVVVDEADRMADMGFLPAVDRLLETVERPRQVMLFSATLSRAVERLVARHMSDPVRHLLELAVHDLGSRSHEFLRTAQEERTALTARLVETIGSSIVFCRTKHGVDRLARNLAHAGLAVAAIHGDRSQAQRDRALAQFRDGRAQVLVGTDVASRGLHVEGVDCVIHFDPPEDEDTYVHRSGRTGRAGATGRVVSLVTPEHERLVRHFERRFATALASEGGPSAPVHPEGRPSAREKATTATPRANVRRRSPTGRPADAARRRSGGVAAAGRPRGARRAS